MRTTIEIQDGILEYLSNEARRHKTSLKNIVNEYLLKAIEADRSGGSPSEFVGSTFDLGHPPRMDVDRALELSSALEDEELVRKMRLET